MNLLQLFSPWKWATKCVKPRRTPKRDRERLSFRPRLEVLEDRMLLTAYVVDLATDNNSGGPGQQDPNDAKAGDLRYCLNKVNAGVGNSITFAQANGKNVYTIDLQAALPTISQSMTITEAPTISTTVERSATATTDFRIFNIASGKTVTLGGFTIQNGLLKDGEGDGAGIYNSGILILDGTVVQNNKTTTGNGGGIYNVGNLTLDGGSMSANRAVDGGGIFNLGAVKTAKGAHVFAMRANTANQDGGDIFNAVEAIAFLSKLAIENCTAVSGDGGGIFNAGNAQLDIQDSKFDTDQAISGSSGGIYNNGNVTINQCTFVNCSAGLKGGAIRETTGTGTGNGNTVNGNKVTGVPGALAADETGGGISVDPTASFSLVNSIVAQNTAPTNPDVDGNFTDNGHNFIGNGTGGDFINGRNGDQVGDSVNPLNPMLGPLQDNGGGIDTELPLAGSPVIDAGDNSYALSADSRGYVRIINQIIDIGAVEYNSYAPNVTSVMTLSSSAPNNAALNQPVTFTANLSGGSDTPSGSITFLSNGALLGTATLDANGNATLTTSNLPLGSNTITAVYSGDDTYASNSAFLNQTINQGNTSTSLSVSANPAQPGQAVTFTATLSYNNLAGTPTGVVTFLDGSTRLGTGTLTQVGNQLQATDTTSALSSGSHAITAVYGGDDTFMASSSSTTETVGQASGISPGVSLTASANPALLNQSVTLTATVSGMSGTPTGTVTFLDGTTVLGTGTLSVVNGQAQATLTTSALGLGAHDLLAVYSGDGTYAPIANTMTLLVNQGGTSTTLSSNANPSPAGQSVTFTATVMATGMGAGRPSGTVSFYDGSTFLGAGTLTLVNGQMQATFTTAALGLGSHRIIAVYNGDSTFADSGAALQQSIS